MEGGHIKQLARSEFSGQCAIGSFFEANSHPTAILARPGEGRAYVGSFDEGEETRTARVAAWSVTEQRFLGGSIAIGRGTVSHLAGVGTRIVALLPWVGEMVVLRPVDEQ